MIKMISGVYGMPVTHDGGRVTVERVGPGYGSFSLSADKEKRLVDRGVAVYVQPATEAVQDEAEIPAAPIGFDEIPPEDTAEDVAELKPLTELSAAELREIGAEYGLAFKANMSKAKMIAEIEAYQEQHMDDAEDAPSFDAAEAVQ